jgi:hypothetical protein
MHLSMGANYDMHSFYAYVRSAYKCRKGYVQMVHYAVRTYVRTCTYVPLRQRYVSEYPLGTYVTCVVVHTYVRGVRSTYEHRNFPKHNQIYKKLKASLGSNCAMKPVTLPYMCNICV